MMASHLPPNPVTNFSSISPRASREVFPRHPETRGVWANAQLEGEVVGREEALPQRRDGHHDEEGGRLQGDGVHPRHEADG